MDIQVQMKREREEESGGKKIMVLFLAWRAMVLRSSLQSRFTVAMMFWRVGMIPSTLNSSDRWNPGICVVGGEERPAAAFGVMVTGVGAVVSREI